MEMRNYLAVVVTLTVFNAAVGAFDSILDTCCFHGTLWADQDERCDNFPDVVAGVEDADQPSCRALVEVCCMKKKQQDQCLIGRDDALASHICSIRDDVFGSEQYKECCHCCHLGLQAKGRTLRCDLTRIGGPCDQIFRECCTGNTLNPNGYFNQTSPSDRDRDRDGHPERQTDDIDECRQFPDKLCDHNCINTVGSYHCECRQGYRLMHDGRTCRRTEVNVEQCAVNNPCQQQCLDTVDGIRCFCLDGFTLGRDEVSCSDIDECRLGLDECPDGQTCVNNVGSYRCQLIDSACRNGYVFNPATQQCEPQHVVDCPNGYAFHTVEQRCEDIDECIVEQHSCGNTHQICRNTPGSFMCDCDEGFRYNEFLDVCDDIDECALHINHCTAEQRCENNIGSYECRRITGCGTGYTLNEMTQQCEDQNECELNTHNCASGYNCRNLQGSFRCLPTECPNGYRFNPSTGNCQQLVCSAGYQIDRSTCADIDECSTLNICLRNQPCVNTMGSYYCRDIVNCGNGYELDQSTDRCNDVDECSEGSHDCRAGQTCINRPGSYICQCRDGYHIDGTGQCQDIDECRYGTFVCPRNSLCENTQGSYTCACNEGLQRDGRQCVDIDECLEPVRCHHKCVNIVGSFHCTCNAGFQLSTDQRLCEDVDECSKFSDRGRLCGGSCQNVPGSYRCNCPDGWRLMGNGRSCHDIDECAERTARCRSANHVCFNTRGNYKCVDIVCPSGFIKTPLSPRRNSEVILEAGDSGALCTKLECERLDIDCFLNKTKTISWQFIALPTLQIISGPTTLLNIETKGYAIYPNLFLRILGGNEQHLFQTQVDGDTAALQLVKPLIGPAEYHVILQLENRNFLGSHVISAHITHVFIDVSLYEF